MPDDSGGKAGADRWNLLEARLGGHGVSDQVERSFAARRHERRRLAGFAIAVGRFQSRIDRSGNHRGRR